MILCAENIKIICFGCKGYCQLVIRYDTFVAVIHVIGWLNEVN